MMIKKNICYDTKISTVEYQFLSDKHKNKIIFQFRKIILLYESVNPIIKEIWKGKTKFLL